MASLAAISSDSGHIVSGNPGGITVLTIVIVWVDTTPFHFCQEFLHGIVTTLEALSPLTRGRRMDTINRRIPDLRIGVL